MTTIKSDLPVILMLLILQHVIDFMLRNFLQRFKDLSQFIRHDITSAITIKNTKCLLRFFLVEGELILCYHQLNEFFKVHLPITWREKNRDKFFCLSYLGFLISLSIGDEEKSILKSSNHAKFSDLIRMSELA